MGDGSLPSTPTPGPGTVAIRRSVLLGSGAVLTASLAWAGLLTWYMVFKDDFAGQVFRQQTEMQFAYEERIAALKAEEERARSRRLVDQNRLEARVTALAARQAQIEAQSGMLSSLTEQTLGHVEPMPVRAPRNGDAPLPAVSRAKPSPLPDNPGLRRGADPDPAPTAVPERLSALESSLARVADTQIRAADSLRKTASGRLAYLQTTLGQTGLDPEALNPLQSADGGKGGPFVPYTAEAATDPFTATIGQTQSDVIRFDRLRRVARSLPFTRPVPGEVDQTSPFGYRRDPFTGAAALHSGVDLRAEYGTPIRAAGPGRVVSAEPTSGYGNMVEIEHGNGVATRYAHLSAITVKEGDSVEAGAIVGRAGSTGRSTGSHLHYETRINGQPVDPQRFLRVGALLAGAPVRTAAR